MKSASGAQKGVVCCEEYISPQPFGGSEVERIQRAEPASVTQVFGAGALSRADDCAFLCRGEEPFCPGAPLRVRDSRQFELQRCAGNEGPAPLFDGSIIASTASDSKWTRIWDWSSNGRFRQQASR